MQFYYNQLILICLSTTVLLASSWSWNRGSPPLLAHRRTPPVPYYNRFPLPYQHIPSKQPWPRQDVLPLPQQDNVTPSPFATDIPDPDPFFGGNYSTPTTLKKPYLFEPVVHDDNSTEMTPDPQNDFSLAADEKKSKDKNKDFNKTKNKYKSEFQPPPPPPPYYPGPPPPIPDIPPILPMFYLVDEPAPYYDYDFDLRYPYPQQEKQEDDKKKDQEETTTLAPFTIADVKVPAAFLRIETMICFTILGLCYGLGFLVLFQSLCVPAAKLATVLVYVLLLKNGLVEPVTLEQAIQQLPPT